VKVITLVHVTPAGAAPLGQDDSHALAHGLALVANSAATLTAVLAGAATDTAPLRQALESGAGRAVRVVGDDLAGADFHTLGQVLAAGIKRLGADLVLAGARSDDQGIGAVPAATARQLGFVYVSAVEEIAPTDAPSAIEVVVRGGGRKRRLRVTLPAVLSIVAGPRAPVTAATRASATPEIEVVSLADPERTVVRRRTELLGTAEPAAHGAETVTSSAALITALTRP
jgi:electron transfer flavoprotein alpha/beta subunit